MRMAWRQQAVPSPNLFGSTAMERADTRQWQRRVEQQIILPIFDGYRWGPRAEFFIGGASLCIPPLVARATHTRARARPLPHPALALSLRSLLASLAPSPPLFAGPPPP